MTKQDVLTDCESCPIRHNAVCAHCDRMELAILERAKSYRTHPAGAMLAEAGRDLGHFSSIVSGCASMSRTLEDGRRQNVGLLLPSDYIGRPGRTQAAFDVQALTPVTLCRFERETFEKLMHNTPHICERLMDMTLDELEAAREWTVVLGRLTAREKVASFLVMLLKREASLSIIPLDPSKARIQLPLSREAMADHLGLTIETTSRQMSALRKEGLIDLVSSREIRVPDVAALAAEAGLEDRFGNAVS